MSLQRRAADATIARLELRADRGDPLAARLAAERLLGAIDLRPGNLPPSAILCVRALRDPLPRTVSLDSRQLRPPHSWERALQREVDRLARDATRPAREPVPAAAEAVVFADEAELLACLGHDLVAGAISARWWWRLLVEGIEQPRIAAIRAWRGAPSHVPAALHALAARGEATAFVRMLEPSDGRALADAVAEQFALRGGAAGSAAPAARRSTTAGAALSSAAPAPARPMPAPWAAIAPEADEPALHAEHRALLGIALTIVRAPQLARSSEFALGIAAWRLAIASPRVDDAAPEPPPARSHPEALRLVESTPHRAAQTIEAAHAPPPLPAGDARGPATAAALVPGASAAAPAADAAAPAIAPGSPPPPPPTGPLDRPAAAPEPAPSATRSAAPAPHSDEETAGSEPDIAAPSAPPEGVARRAAPVTDRSRSPGRPDRALGPAIVTQHGGLFYLVNLALYLRLYGGDDDLALSLWDFVALVGRALLGDAIVADDLVWPLLAELAGRDPDEPPGAGFAPPDDWRLPSGWLAPFAAAPLRAWSTDDRLTVAHPEGFLVLDVAAEGERDAQLARELAHHGDPVWAPGGDPAPALTSDRVAGAPLDRWLARLVPYLRARLRGALAVDDAGLPALLLAHRARVHATDAHLDVVLALDTLPIEIRIAGLDRDPGWVAAAGRFIAFHFE